MQRIHALLQSKNPVKWLFYGDSITHGSSHTYGHRDYTQLFAERIRHELNRPMDLILNSAISAHTTHELLEQFAWRVQEFKPHAVFIMIGMNDCFDQRERRIPLDMFRANLGALCEKIEKLPALAILQTTCPIIPGGAPGREPHFDAYMDAIRETASHRKLPLIDHTSFWKELVQEDPQRIYYWMNNAFHPNAYGHQVFALHLYQKLGIFDPTKKSCQFFVPATPLKSSIPS